MADAVDSTSVLLNTFIETIARITSYALTDKEKESVVTGFRRFHQQLERLRSSSDLRRMAIESKKRQREVTVCLHEGTTCTQNAVRGFLKAFLVGYVVKYGLSVAPHILTLKLFRKPSILLRAFNRDTASFATFLSVLIGSYKGFLCTLRHWRGANSNDYTNALVAGALAGLISIKLDRSRSRRTAVTLYAVSRAIQYGCMWAFDRWTNKQQKLKDDRTLRQSVRRSYSAGNMIARDVQHKHMKGLKMSQAGPGSSRDKQNVRWSPDTEDNSKEAKRLAHRSEVVERLIGWVRKYSSTALMAASCCVLGNCILFETDVMPRGYVKFLTKASGYEKFYPDTANVALKSIAETVARATEPGSLLHGRIPAGMTTKEYAASSTYADVLLPPLSDTIKHGFGVCGTLHPQTESCTKGLLYILFNVFPLAMRVYTPLNAAVLLLFKRHRLAKDPRGVILSLIKSSIRSSVFLAVLIVGIINFSCGMRALLGRETYWSYIITGSVGGLAVLLEAPSRRVELAMYCFLRALESGWDVGVKRR
ncbi:hypothetical protein FBU59_004903, partial [Linderina macrospora]